MNDIKMIEAMRRMLAMAKSMQADIEQILQDAPPAPVPVIDHKQTLETFLTMARFENYLILDTETTGLNDGEIVQIAIIDANGTVLLDTYVKPVQPIPADARRIHGITDEMVKSAPGWDVVCPQVQQILSGTPDLIVYNAVYERKMMHKSGERHGLPKTEWKNLCRWWCAMEAFAEVYGDWNEYRASYRWQKLVTAPAYYNVPQDSAHSALGDCLMTLGVVKGMCK